MHTKFLICFRVKFTAEIEDISTFCSYLINLGLYRKVFGVCDADLFLQAVKVELFFRRNFSHKKLMNKNLKGYNVKCEEEFGHSPYCLGIFQSGIQDHWVEGEYELPGDSDVR